MARLRDGMLALGLALTGAALFVSCVINPQPEPPGDEEAEGSGGTALGTGGGWGDTGGSNPDKGTGGVGQGGAGGRLVYVDAEPPGDDASIAGGGGAAGAGGWIHNGDAEACDGDAQCGVGTVDGGEDALDAPTDTAEEGPDQEAGDAPEPDGGAD